MLILTADAVRFPKLPDHHLVDIVLGLHITLVMALFLFVKRRSHYSVRTLRPELMFVHKYRFI